MEDQKSNGHLSESLRRKLENFPEEFPSENDWQHLRGKIQSEGLLRKKSNRKRYLLFLLLLLIAGTSALLTVPTWIKKQEHAVEIHAQQAKPAIKGKNNIRQNKSSEESSTSKNKNVKPGYEEKAEQKVSTKKPVEPKHSSHALNERNPRQENKNAKLLHATKTKQANVPSSTSEFIKDQKENIEDSTPVEINSASSEMNTDAKKESITDAIKETETGNAVEAGTRTDTSEIKNTSVAMQNNDSVSSVQTETVKTDSTATVLSSEDKTKQANSSGRKIQVGLFVSWDRNTYHLKESSNADKDEADYILNSDSISGKKSVEQFTVGLRGSYLISNKIALEAGLFYSQKRKIDAAIYTPQYSSSSSGESISDFVYHFNARYFEIEERIKYFVYQKNPLVYISAGAKESFNLSQSNPDYFEHTVYSTSAPPHTERVLLKPAFASTSLVFAAGAEVPFNSRCNFFIEPSYTYALDAMINNPSSVTVPVNLFRRSFSIGTGLNYKF